MKSMKHLLTIGLLLLAVTTFCQQSIVSMVSPRDSVSIGEPFRLGVTVTLSGNAPAGTIDFSPMDTIKNLMYEADTTFFNETGDITLIDGGKFQVSAQQMQADLSRLEFANVNGNYVLKDSITVAIYDVGQFFIPLPELNLINQSEVFPTASPLISVYLPQELQQRLQDSIEVAPIVPIIDEPVQLEDFTYLFIALGILLAAILFIYITRKLKKKKLEEPKPEVIIPAHIIATEKLDSLKAKELWQQGDIKGYQSELTFIIREYLENRFNLAALEMTTDETLKSVPEEVNQEKLRNILQIADMVKFAKAEPSADIHNQFMDMAYEIIQSTKETEQPADD